MKRMVLVMILAAGTAVTLFAPAAARPEGTPPGQCRGTAVAAIQGGNPPRESLNCPEGQLPKGWNIKTN
jgi:hypothetical protein